MELPATSVLSLFDTNKEQRASFAENVLSKLRSGEVNPLNIHIQVKCLEDTLKRLLEDQEYKQFVVDEAEKYERKTFEVYNAFVTLRETGTTWDYTNCNDPEYRSRKRMLDKAKAMVEEREKFLKTVPASGMEILIADELVTVYPPAKKSTTTAVVTLK